MSEDYTELARRWAPTLIPQAVTIHDRPTAPPVPAQDPQAAPAAAGAQDEDESGKAFISEINGKTFLTASAQVASLREPSVEDIAADRMLMMSGRFVGADEPNRNGAMWSAADLEAARATVVNGPLNWLHEARHVIGTLTDAQYVPGETAADGAGRPHIAATAGIWKWIYPDEAYVVQQASDSQMLWYSMECISKEVACAGEGGCGNITTYAAYMAGAACDHVKERASVRQFKNPVFLGGAVIVPPTRPGWAHADAQVMHQANALAEAAYEAAGSPADVTATQWEQLMAQLVRFAS